jgi:hypothetical protein
MEFKPRAAALTCILMFATFLEMSFFFFLYERCPECLLSIAFILTYWVLVSSLNMVLGLSFIILTGKTDPARKRAAALIGALVLIALLTLVNYAICTSFQ